MANPPTFNGVSKTTPSEVTAPKTGLSSSQPSITAERISRTTRLRCSLVVELLRLLIRATASTFFDITSYKIKADKSRLILCHALKNEFNIIQIQQLKEGSYRFRSESRGDLIIPKRPSRGCSGFSYIGPKLWNKLSKGLRETYDPEPFRRQLKHWIRSSIPD